MLKRIFVLMMSVLLTFTALSAYAQSADNGTAVLAVELDTKELYVVLGGESRPLSATLRPAGATDKRVYWMSSNDAVATVDANGNVTARSLGTATITAFSSNFIESTCTVIVTDSPATELTISESSITLEERSAYSLNSTVLPVTADNLEVRWTSSDKSVAVVNQNGKVFSKSAGTCTITATTHCGGLAVAQCEVTVTPSDKPMKYVALTFDDGPKQGRTDELLDLLDMYDVDVTFFCQGQFVKQYPNLVIRAHELGNEIANHTYNHETLTTLSLRKAKKQLTDADAAIEAVIGIPASVYRAPGGSVNEKIAKECGKPFIHWDVDTNDWKYRDPEHVWTFIAKHTENYDVVLMHDIHDTTIEAMYKALPYLLEQGYTMITVSELLEMLDWNDPSLIYRPNK